MRKKKRQGPGGREIATAYKLLVVQERLKGTPEADVATAFGVSKAAVTKWTNAFRRHGASALGSKRGRGGKTGLRPLRPSPVREQIVELKRTNEDWGSRRIRDVLARFEALGVSEQQVRRILHEEGLLKEPVEKREREHEPRRFERAMPNQLWQSDIFTFRLRRSERLYVCVFMDDHSRFVVGHALAHHQKSALVMEAFERGIAAYGNPKEVLTDNGRQYTVWRGKTEFEEMLKRLGIDHIRSRPQHPQTLGKVERFWKTLWDEFLERTVFAHVVDAQRRLEHYISHYNFQRPHQAIDGLVPADRFFKAAAHVRAEIERQVAANELRLALEQPPRKPFYVVGQLGDQRLSIAAGATGLEVHVGGKTETIPLKEETDATRTARRFAEEAPEPADTALAGEEVGPGRGRTEPSATGPVGPVRREAGDERDPGRGDLARLLLPARDEGDQRDAARAGAGLGWRREYGRDDPAPAHQAARREAHTSRSGATPSGAPLVCPAEADELGAGEDRTTWPTAEDNRLDAHWAEKLALVDDDERESEINQGVDEAAGFEPIDEFDPDAGWRERGPLKWERKLAGASAASDNQDDGEEQTSELHAGAGAAGRSRAASTLRHDRSGAVADPERERSSARVGPVEEPLPDDLASRGRSDDRGADAKTGWTAGEAGTNREAGSRESAAARGAGGAEGALGDDRTDDDDGRWHRIGTNADPSLEGQEDQERGSRACAAPAPGDSDA
jgi:transposase InsO family protein